MVGSVDHDGMRIAQRQVQLVVLHGGAIADAFHQENLLEALGDANDHIVDQRAVQTMHRAMGLAVGRTGDDDFAADLFDLHILIDLLTQFALRALDGHGVVVRDGHGNAGGNRNRKLTDSTHSSVPPTLTRYRPELRRRCRRCGPPCRSSRPWTWRRWRCPVRPEPSGSRRSWRKRAGRAWRCA